MNAQTRSLLGKEWIKLRRGIWLLPLLVAYAGLDSLLTLNTIQKVHGPFGLWATLISKQPPFFDSFALLIACGIILGFLQAWPECQGKRLRLMFHMPVNPLRMLSVTLATGLAALMLINLLAHGVLACAMLVFHLPLDIIGPVLLSVAPWSILSLAAYCCSVAFFGSQGLPMKLVVLACAHAMASLLWPSSGYAVFAPSLWAYALLALDFLPLVYFAYWRFLGDPQGKPLFHAVRGVSLLLAVLGLCSVLPGLYWRSIVPERIRVSLFYSPVHEQFVLSMAALNKAIGPLGAGEVRYFLEDGREISRREYAQALPILYADDLIKWKEFPQSIAGVRISPQEAKAGWQFLHFVPRDWNCPPPMLHMLLESNPVGAKLEMPKDVFRPSANGQGIEFLRPEDGSLDREKSRLFTEALRRVGFSFPVQALGGNPDPRKDYDIGYFLVDARNGLFQMQMVDGAPHCMNSGQIVPGRVRGVLVSEHRRREFYGFVVTDSALFAIMMRDMSLQPLPLSDFSAESTQLWLFSDLLGKSLVSNTLADWEAGTHGLALGPDFTVRHAFPQPVDPHELQAMAWRRCLASALFPLQVFQRDPGSKYVQLALRPADVFLAAAASGLAMLGLLILLRRRLGLPVRLWDCALVLTFGPVALLVIGLVDWRKPLRLSKNS